MELLIVQEVLYSYYPEYLYNKTGQVYDFPKALQQARYFRDTGGDYSEEVLYFDQHSTRRINNVANGYRVLVLVVLTKYNRTAVLCTSVRSVLTPKAYMSFNAVET